MSRALVRIIALLCIAVWLTIGIVPVQAAETAVSTQGYTDVSKNYYASKEIASLSQRGIIKGYEDGSFKPDEEVTRGVTALWLSKALKLGFPASLKGFTDVPETSEYAVAINILAEKNIVQGDNGRFAPDAPLTREQMASLLVRAFQLKDNSMNVWFKDESAMGDSHFKDIIRLKQHFLTNQVEYMPKDKVTRAQLALFLYRAIMIGEPERGQIPVEDFMRGSDVGGYQVSPDGKYTALMKQYNNQQHIYVYKKGQEKKDAVRITTAKDREVLSFTWFNDDTIIYTSTLGGDENNHIHSVHADGTADKDLTPFDKVKAQFIENISYVRNHEHDILIAMNRNNPQLFDAYQLDVLTGQLTIVANNPGNVVDWMPDLYYGEIKLAVAIDGTDTKILYRASVALPFETVLTLKYGDDFVPIMFSFDNTELFALSNIGRDKLALVKFNLGTKKMGETIYENPNADVTDIVVSYRKRAILAVEYETDKHQYYFLDKEFEQLYQDIAAKLPGQSFKIVGNPLPDDKVTVRSYSDRTPGAYHFYSRKNKSIEKYADVRPWIDPEQMAEMKPISYPSSDGLFTIHGYLTLPKQGGSQNLPLVVIPHGGPAARDSWGYDPEVQLLANRGYAVLQVNFRGSTGYGKKFLSAGNKQWGQAMQNDITDGVKWLIQQGIANPKKVAIYGASYGGYAALAGVTYTPELYVAGIDYVGPSSLFTLLNNIPPYWEPSRQMEYEQIGDPVKDKAMMEAYSPVLHADQIQAPIFFAQGVNDPRVNKRESDQMVMALRQRGIDSQYMVKDGEGHGFHKFENKVDFYTAMLKFLEIHMNQ